MKLCLFDRWRVGIVGDDGVRDVTSAVPGHEPDPTSAFWVRLCRDFEQLRPRLEAVAAEVRPVPLDQVTLAPPALNPSKIVAAASNYGDHVQEMAPRVPDGWMLDFDTFLKAPSSLLAPGGTIELPDVGDREIHHEVELAVVIGRRARDVDEADALDHVLGYTGLMDTTVRGGGDRSRRKSYDTFTPLGPWVVTRDEVADPHDVDLELLVNGQTRQSANTNHLLVTIPAMLAHASRILTLHPGDIFATGTPAGVGPIVPGDEIVARVGGVGTLTASVRARTPQAVAAGHRPG